MEKFKHRYAPKMFKYNPSLCSFRLQLIFFSEKPFYGNYWTLDSHINTVISHMFAYFRSRWRRIPWQSLLFTASVVLVQCHNWGHYLGLDTSALSKSGSNVSWVPIVRSSIFVILDFSDSSQTQVRPTSEQFWEFLLCSIFQVRKSC